MEQCCVEARTLLMLGLEVFGLRVMVSLTVSVGFSVAIGCH